jgi:hypothetical protein
MEQYKKEKKYKSLVLDYLTKKKLYNKLKKNLKQGSEISHIYELGHMKSYVIFTSQLLKRPEQILQNTKIKL